MPNLGGAEWLILIAIIALLFGAKRLPDAARGLGRSMRIFKAETKGLVGGDDSDAAADQEAPAVTAAPAVSATPAEAATVETATQTEQVAETKRPSAS
jgi:sec-independent protein translocase protein TatA